MDATTITSFNFTNVRKNNVSGKRLKIWSIENFDFSYSYTRSEHHNSVTVEDELINYKGGLGYNYVGIPKFWEPFKKTIKSRSKWFTLFKDFNLNPIPSTLTFRADINRQFGAFRARNVGDAKEIIPETFNKFFTFDRLYVLRWDITRSINIDFAATNKAWVDEDSGRLDKAGQKAMWQNFWKGGRTVYYNQNANFTYTIPTTKVPFLDWTSFRLGYGSSYSWTAASLVAPYLGNNIQTRRSRTQTGNWILPGCITNGNSCGGSTRPHPRYLQTISKMVKRKQTTLLKIKICERRECTTAMAWRCESCGINTDFPEAG